MPEFYRDLAASFRLGWVETLGQGEVNPAFCAATLFRRWQYYNVNFSNLVRVVLIVKIEDLKKLFPVVVYGPDHVNVTGLIYVAPYELPYTGWLRGRYLLNRPVDGYVLVFTYIFEDVDKPFESLYRLGSDGPFFAYLFARFPDGDRPVAPCVLFVYGNKSYADPYGTQWRVIDRLEDLEKIPREEFCDEKKWRFLDAPFELGLVYPRYCPSR